MMLLDKKSKATAATRKTRYAGSVIETFSAPSAKFGQRIASKPGTSAEERAEYGRMLGRDVEEFGRYIMSKRLGRALPGAGR